MPLVVSSLTGDASDMFDWMRSVSPEGAQDLSALLQMLREHYCGSFTFWEQRNMVENLHQGAHEDATDFMYDQSRQLHQQLGQGLERPAHRG